MRALRPGDSLDIVVRHNGNGYCVVPNDTAHCGIGFTAGNGWALLMYPESIPDRLKGLLDLAWVAGLVLPAGVWATSRWGLLVAVGGAAVGSGSWRPRPVW